MSSNPRQLDVLGPAEKRALLAQLLKEKASKPKSFPLSYAQQRLWFLDQMSPGTDAYNIPSAMRLRGTLDIPALTRSLNEIIRRHEALRTTFQGGDGEPVQLIARAAALTIPIVELESKDASEREAELQRLIREETAQAFDLARGPLLRAKLLRVEADDHVLLLTLHHIICDGWSIGVFMGELAALYEAYTSGQESPLAKLPIQYADYARWQREWLQGEVLDRQLSYWKEQLAGAPAVLELPTDRPRSERNQPGAYSTFRISTETTKGLNELSRNHGATLFMTLLAAFQTLLFRYSGQDDIVVGSPIAGRNRAETENLIGFFINTLVLRTSMSGDPSFRELLVRVKETALGAYAHQDVPFERLVEELQPQRSLNHSPLFQVMLAVQHQHSARLQLPGVSLETMAVGTEAVKFDLTLLLAEDGEGLDARLEYNRDLFEAETIARLIGHFEVLVESVITNPEQQLSKLELLTPAEREQLLVHWNQTTTDYSQHRCIHQLFEEQVQRTPENTAVGCGEQRLSYAELNRRANQLAHHLRREGVGPEVLVGVCMERSIEMMVALLGILKAGGAYLPLDPTYPRARLAFMLEDAAVPVLLTQARLAECIPHTAASILSVDANWEQLSHLSVENPRSTVTPENLAYVIYTSGSTGQPKGVEVQHGGLVNLVCWHQREYGVTPVDRATQLSGPSFDASVWEMWPYLAAGASIYIPDAETRMSAAKLVDWITAESITITFLPTPLAEAVLMTLEEQWPAGCALRNILTGGDQLHRWPRTALPVSLTNHYGPTENTVVTTAFPVATRASGEAGRALPPIGRPIANTEVYILDQYQRPVPIGIAGELHIGGDALARGYLKRPELSAERFIPNPFSSTEGARLYKTGDLASYLPDGNIEFRGRIDKQVKVRGFRIELGEIEAALIEHPLVRECVLAAREDAPGEKRLVAYIVRQREQALPVSELRGYLSEKLPDHMIPAVFVTLDRLPLTPNGKIDRQSLPAPESSRPELESSFTAPRTLVEQRLAHIWTEVLHLAEVGVDDDFFALGGHSLLVMQVMARVRKSFQIELPVRSLFENPTIARLAQRVETALRTGQNLPAPPIVPVSRDKQLPLSFAQQRMWFLAQMEPDAAVYNVPVAVRMTGDLQLDALEWSFSEVLRRHEALRTTFVAVDGIARQVINEAEPVALPVLDLSGLAKKESEAQRLIREEGKRPFDLEHGPLLRVRLLRLGAEEYVLLCTLHHIVSDGWSMEVLVREITTLYQAYVSGEPSSLPELEVQYADFAAWQREWLQDEVLEAQLFYWRRQLGELPEVLELPTKGPRPAVQTYCAGGHGLSLSERQKEAFQALAYGEGTTLFITLLAAFQTLLWHYTRQEQVSVGTPTAGRDRVEIGGLIGCFVNTLVMATDLSGDPSFREVLQRVKEVALGAYAHQDVPFERVVEELQPERSLSHSPLFQVMMVLQNTRDGQLQLPGVSLETIDLESETVKFDLMLTLTEAEKGLEGRLGYNTDLFEAETIARMAGHFEVLVESVVSNPEQRLSELQLLTAVEQEQLLVGFNQTEVEYPHGDTLAQLFEQQAARTPQATALVYEGERVSYGELNRRANQLARHLQGLGVGPEVVVGLCIERSPEMVMGLLGILKAGGAYLPLDPAYPAARLAFMMADAHAPVLLTQQRLLTGLGEQPAEVLCLDADWESFTRHSDENLEVEVQPTNLAYVIYTSGSTGQPKGVMITQQAICNHMRWMQDGFPLSAEDAVLQKTPFSFDASVWEFYAPLFAGGRLVLAQPGGHQNSGYLVQTMATEGVTVLQVVPTLLQMLVQEPGLSECRELKRVFCGGEILTRGLAAQLQAQLPGVELYNLYGPTEAAIDVTCWQCGREDVPGDEWSEWSGEPIGRAIANVKLYVLDQGLKPVPVGVSGELYIGGAGLARGYYGRAELTAERFVPHPYSSEPGARLYRTGDVARYRSDGALEYVARVDHQVKVRGYRIELGEIEAALLASVLVREAVVVVRSDGEAQQLVAYVVCADGVTSSELRAGLQGQLPDYMVPTQYVLLERLPLTPSGKVDRRALPAPDNTRPELESSFTTPRTLVEQRLAQIWGEVLHLAEVGVEDNFFALGGHSLLVMQVMARVRKAFQIELPLRSLFESPTIERLAQRVETAMRLGQNLPAPPIVPVSRNKQLPLSFAQQRMWFLAQMEPNVTVYNIPAAVRMSGSLNIAALERSFSEVVRRHEALRTTFVAHDGIPVQVIHEAEPVAIPVLDLSGFAEKESEAQRLIREEGKRPFDLARGPLLRVGLLQLGAEEYVLLLTLHHIVSDAWSTEVLVREITTLYQAYVSGEPSSLPELAVQYADYAAWQREWLQGEVLEAQLFYWRHQLEALPEVLELPTKGPRPAVQTYRAAGQALMLSERQKEAFQALAYGEGTTLFITLLATFQTLLWHYTRQEQVSVGTPTAGRDRVEIEGLIGCFVNTLVMATDLSGDPTFREVLQRVKEVALGAYAHQDVPFERLVEELQPERSLSHSPLFQVMMVLQNERNERLQLSGVSLEPLDLHSDTIKFDLMLTLIEAEQGLDGWLRYNTDLFEAETIARMVDHFAVLVDSVLQNPEQRLSELQLLSAAEREQLLVEWNHATAAYPDKSIHELFEEQVLRQPDALAVMYADERISYAELNERANQLAHYLQSLGVGPEVIVGLCVERSMEMVVGLLAILKAGGAYLPMDPSYPRERLAFMLADAEVKVLLTQTHLRDSFAAAHVICLDAAGPLLAGYPLSNPVTTATGDNLAYVIYTSGSTGRPKGVLIRRRAVTNLGYGLQEAIYQRLGCAGGLRVSVNAPLVFDASVKQVVQLGWGHTLCVIPDEVRGDGEALLAHLAAQRVDVLDATPAQVHLLLTAAGGAELGSGRAVLVGGEAIDESLWALMSGSRTTQYYNVYGPTECTVDTTTRRVEGARTSLGRGLGNVDVYLLDQGLKLAPVGVAGELCVGGAGLARCYLNRPELTAEKFIPHPYSSEPGARLYRTGDVARYRSDGALEYVGRVDHQVKVRGYRIELGEIEAALLASVLVHEAVVMVRGEGGTQQLVAYVVCADGPTPASAELRAELQGQLPDYMVPTQYVLLERLPLTPSGKVDRRSLPAPDNTRPELESSFRAPRTLVEQRLAQIWGEVLHLSEVGVEDNFFALGGHSLLVMQVIARVRKTFQIELPLRGMFESPTIERLAQRVETAMRLGQNLPAPPIVPVSRNQQLPLSFAQQRMWFLAQMEPDVAVYNIPAAVRMIGSLNIAALERSFSEVVRRHEALRTTFVAHDGIPVQVIHEAQPVAIPVLDLSGWEGSERESEGLRLIREERRRPFDLARGPLLRAGLLRLGAEEYVLLLTLHHIVSDGWSMEVLVREITSLYQAYVSGESSPLAELTVQYADYAAWQREWLQGEVLEAQLFYWRRQLEELPEVLELPTKGPRPAVQTYRAGGHALSLSERQKEAFQALAYGEGTTLFITLLAAFQTLLWHYTRQEQVSVGTPTAGRDRVEIEGLIGCFVNTLVMATDLSGNPTFREVLQRVKEVALGAYAHQDVPFERLVEELQPERSLSHSPLFQVMMVLQNTRDGQLQLPGVSLESIDLESETVKFDLLLTLTEADPKAEKGLEGWLGYNTDLFEPETIARMAGHFEVLVESVVSNPEQRLSELQLLTAAEREQLLVGFNQTEVEYPHGDTLAQLFEQQAARTPEAVALVYEGEQVSYGELNRRANQLARHLQELGVGAEVVVGLCVERSPEMVMGLLGILKAGGAYLPLDPAYPAARLAFMMADAHAPVLLTQQRLLTGLGEQPAEVLCLDADWESFTRHSDENLDVEVQATNLAYVIYTSGSTGQPKGVMITQQAICNHMRWMQDRFPLSAEDAVLQKTPFSFDASVWEFYAPLFVGGRLVLAQPGGHQDCAYLVQTIAAEGVTVLQVVPTLLQMLVQEPGLSECRELKRVFCGGEILTRGLAAQLQAQLPGVELYNLYGPTEAAIDVTCWLCGREDVPGDEWSEWSGVPIGRAIANVKLYVLDQGLKPAPVGVSGELYIGGAGLARGYYGRAELTAERFVPHPYSSEPGARLYRTGDVARYRADGALEYVARVDHQVKVRGYRIELGEIEAALLASVLVREAVVVVRSDGEAQQLVAYVVCADGVTSAELRAELQGQLPDYMVPTQYMILERLPLTPSGKVDRRALPTPDNTRPELESSFTAPRTLVEQRLAQIWGEVLHLSEVGVEDNFFALGGHSLLVMQVMARVRKAFQIELPLRSLFESPTIEKLGQRVETALRLGQNLPAPPIVPVSREQSLPLSFAQQRMWFMAQLEPDVAIYNIPAAVRMIGSLNIAALERSFSEVVRRHEALRTTFVAHDGIPVQVIHDAEGVSIPVLDLTDWEESERESEAQRLIREERRRPFDLARGPLLRVGLLQLGAEEYVLLLTLHHIVSDAWSTEVLVREITTLYQAYVSGEPASLPELTVQYADYAAWQREWLQGEVLEAQLFYWRRQLGELPEVLELPTKGPRPAVQTYRAGGQALQLSERQKEAFQSLGQAEGTTLFITLLAAFQTLLWHYTRQEQVSVGTPTAGRDRVEIEGLIGCFVNTLVMATDLSGDPSFREVLQRVKEVAWGAYAHQDVPFERLVEELSPARDLSWTPLFQVMFMLTTAREEREAIELPGLSLSLIRGTSGGASKFDLTMFLNENSEGELRGSLIYNADLFAESMMSRMSEHFRILVDAVIAKPDVRLSELQLLSAAEREQVQLEWNDTRRDYPRACCIHELFEQQVERTPNAVAVVYGKQQISYRELNERANQLAQHLRKLGVGPDVLAGICMERSLELVVGLFGILKAGGAYVPIDPVYPKDRLASLLHDSRVSILLTEQALLARLPLQGISFVCLDSDRDVISTCDTENLPTLATPQTLAYMIYTSGSTGEPKGVLTQHSSLVNYIDAARVDFGLGPDDRVLQFAPVSFDTASEEIYTCLTSGATLVLRDELMVSSVPAFLQSCRELEITVLDLPTAYWHHLTAALMERRLTLPESLRLVIIGGEKALPERLAIWHRLVDRRVQLLNTYGPTEATIVSTKCDLSAPSEKLETWREVPIGHPVSNAQVYLLDRNLKPVPIGVSGELYIGGEGLARGYFQRPDATAEKFVPDQFSAVPGARLYRSGDLARYLEDGRIEYLGRNDHQVKVRGFRIEVGEIEAVLLRQPQVRDAIVIAREDVPGDKRLVAYVVAAQEPEPSVSELRKALQEKLPEYMMPAAFVLLDKLPLTSNGKIDRRALPAPEHRQSRNGNSHVAPRTPTEQRLAAIWAEVLKHEQIGIHDNFFELGGHSLLATQMVLRVRDAFQIELPLRRLFESATVAGLAQEVDKNLDSGVVFKKQVIAPLPRDAYRTKRSSLQRKAQQDASGDEDLFVFPASFAQQRLWFLDQLKPDSAVYNISDAVRLNGPLDTDAFERAINEITRRHESLRTTFAIVDEQPVQVISPARPTRLPVRDLSDLPEAERESEARRLVTEEAQRPFNLSQGPLLRVSVLKLGDAEHVLLMTMHHIVSDGWSIGVLMTEMKRLYAAFSAGQESPLLELPIQYADFAHAQREWLSGEVLDEQVAYWKQQLSGVPAVLELPTDHPRPPIQTFRGATQSLMLSRALSDELNGLSRREGVTLFMTMMAAFQTLLYRYTGQDEIAVGTPIAGRTSAETERLIGFFINVLVLNTRMQGDLSFRRLISQVKETALGAYAHQDVPFEKLVEELQLRRDISRSPLFQVMMMLHNASPGPGRLADDLKMSSIGGAKGAISKFDLTLSLAETAEGLKAVAEYNTDLFDAATIQRLLSHFEMLLEGIVADPDQTLSRLPVLTTHERQQLLLDWNQTGAAYPRHQCIQHLFEEQAERTPEATAVVCGEQRLSYAELNRRANQLAHYLRNQAVGPEVLVGVCMERSIEMVTALLGILKAGGAYLPLDPSYPQARLSFMLEDAAVPVLLTHSRLTANLPHTAASVMRVDADWLRVSELSVENPAVDVTAENLAYVIYTSGSAGQPKGVEVQHASLMNLVTWHQREYSVTSLDRATQLAGPSFDASVWELWPYLAAGASIHIPDQETRVAAAKLMDWMAAESITITFLPTPLAEAALATLEEHWPTGFTLKNLLTGGDQLQRWPRASLPLTLTNHYGPTENTVVTTSCAVAMRADGPVLPPIGRPIANTEVYILDEHQEPVPIGVAGELHIGGASLARGYLKRPELTAERFIPNPFNPGARLYKTGDLASYLPDGNIEFRGRIDNQVKVRGFRIELGEIETVFAEHPLVRECVVVARDDERGEKRLVAYIVSEHGQTVGVSELRSHLNAKLPDYMVPAAFVMLDELPLTPNGKIDRRALKAPDETSLNQRDAYVAPRDNVELQLVHMWEDLLATRPIGVTDNFFELGGHSLSIVNLMNRIEARFQRQLPLATLFQRGTIEQLAEVLRQQQGTTPQSSLVEIRSGSAKPLFCIHAVGGTVLGYHKLAHLLNTNQAVYGLQARGLYAEEEPHTRIEAMAADYIDALRAVQPQGPYMLAGHSMGGVIAFEMSQQLQQQGEEVALLALIDSWAPVYIPEQDDVTLLVQFAHDLDLPITRDELSQRQPDEQLTYVVDHAQLAHVLPPGVGIEQARRLLQIYKNNVRAVRSYAPQVNQCRITLFRSSEHLTETRDPATGWTGLTVHDLDIHDVPGNHFSMNREPHVRILAERLQNCIDQTSTE